MKRRVLITAGILVVFTALGGWTAWWFFLATYTERALAAAKTPNGEPAIIIGETERFGFPFTIGLALKDARFNGALGAADATATSTLARLSARPWRPRQIKIDLPEGLGYAISGSATTTPFSGKAASGEGMFSFGLEARMELALQNVTARAAGAAPITAQHGRVNWRQREQFGPQEVDISLADLSLGPDALFGPIAKLAETTLLLRGPWPADGAPESIRAWQAADGKIDVQRLRIDWGALDLTAVGAVGLDTAFRPEGNLKLELRNGADAISRLEDLQLLTPTAGSMARILVASASLANGGKATAPLTFANGEARIANFRLGPVHPVCACR